MTYANYLPMSDGSPAAIFGSSITYLHNNLHDLFSRCFSHLVTRQYHLMFVISVSFHNTRLFRQYSLFTGSSVTLYFSENERERQLVPSDSLLKIAEYFFVDLLSRRTKQYEETTKVPSSGTDLYNTRDFNSFA